VPSDLLSTDVWCLVIKLSGQYDMVDFALNSVARSIGISRFTCHTIPECDRHTHTQTDRRTDRYTTTACTVLGKNRPYCTAHQV